MSATHHHLALSRAVVAGAAAGNVTVTGITTRDKLVGVINLPIASGMTTELKADFNLLRAQLLNRCVQACGLAEGTNANTIKTVNAVSFSINGQLYTKAATDNIAMTAAAQQAVSTYCLYLVSIDSAGAVTVTKGTSVATDTAVLPALPASSAPLGFFKVVTDGVTTFTSGTTDLGAAGLTVTFGDLAVANSGTSASTDITTTAPSTDVPGNLTSEFTITAADTINNAAGTSSAGGYLLVLWIAAATRGASLSRT